MYISAEQKVRYIERLQYKYVYKQSIVIFNWRASVLGKSRLQFFCEGF